MSDKCPHNEYITATCLLCENAALKQQIEQLQTDNTKMRECLEWYADKENHEFPETGDYRVSDPLVWEDSGQRARECLSKLGSGSDA